MKKGGGISPLGILMLKPYFDEYWVLNDLEKVK